ncbi:MAG: endonuclease/exonuclease/phosphatase family protein [Oligoflexales bacterium]|nr:endonuclease/exonuclease/phosphatase family protein [Oligoflexales bacterium]
MKLWKVLVSIVSILMFSANSLSDEAQDTKQEEPCSIDQLTLASWNTKHLGRKNFNYDDAVTLLKDFDGITIQEVNTGKSGSTALETLKGKLSEATREKWCSALSEIPTDSKERYAYLWRERKLSWVKNKSGEVIKVCSDIPMTAGLIEINQDKIVREPAIATFVTYKGYKFKFVTVHLVPTNKSPEMEVPYLFEAFKSSNLPVYLAGDFNLPASSAAFDDIRKNGWINILDASQKTSLHMKARSLNNAYDNIWIYLPSKKKGRCDYKGGVKNTYEILKTKDMKEIYKNVSDHTPIYMEISGGSH